MNLKNKKLLIMGGNPETKALVETANSMGIFTIVADPNPHAKAKTVACRSYDIDGLNVDGIVDIARNEQVDGVLVGVADILLGAYQRVCEALNFPCYVTREIVEVFSQKDKFKAKCMEYGLHGIPSFSLDERLLPEDLAAIRYPVMVKPVDNGGGVGMTVCYNESELRGAVEKALSCSLRRCFIVEKYMTCDDMGMYYTFKDGNLSASMIYDRYTSSEQKNLSRVCLGGTYPSKHIDRYFARMHENAIRMFRDMGIQNGVLMLSGFYEDDTFYLYDTGFRLQGEAPHLLLKNIHGYDQREMLIRFSLTGFMGDEDILSIDDPRLGGKYAATLWFLLKEGVIGNLDSFYAAKRHPCVVETVKRMDVGDAVTHSMIGNEKQVLARMYIVCNTKEQLRQALHEINAQVRVTDTAGEDMLLAHFDVDKALG